MENMIDLIYDHTTKRTCLWENGGSRSAYQGQARIVADAVGEKKVAAKRFTGNKARPNAGHALIPVNIHDLVIDIRDEQGHLTLQLMTIDRFETVGGQQKAVMETLDTYTDAQWSDYQAYMDLVSLYPAIQKMIDAACDKVECPNCTHTHYMQDKEWGCHE
jgi:hypothetical protein